MQFVTVRENVVGRRLGVVSLVISSATRGERSQPAVLRVPILPRRDLERFLEALMGDPRWTPPLLEPRPRAARRRAAVRRTVPLLALSGLAGLVTPWAILDRARRDRARRGCGAAPPTAARAMPRPASWPRSARA